MTVIRIPSPSYLFIEKRGDASYVNDTPPFIARGAAYIAQVKTVQVTAVNSYTYQLTINGTTVTYTSSGAATANEVVQGLVRAVNANATTRALVFAWLGSNNELRLEDLDPRQATTSSAGTNLTMLTGRTQASYDYMSSAPGSGTYPAPGVEFWWDIFDAINAYWNLTMGWPANYLPRAGTTSQDSSPGTDQARCTSPAQRASPCRTRPATLTTGWYRCRRPRPFRTTSHSARSRTPWG